jgi:hypothetical protein
MLSNEYYFLDPERLSSLRRDHDVDPHAIRGGSLAKKTLLRHPSPKELAFFFEVALFEDNIFLARTCLHRWGLVRANLSQDLFALLRYRDAQPELKIIQFLVEELGVVLTHEHLLAASHDDKNLHFVEYFCEHCPEKLDVSPEEQLALLKTAVQAPDVFAHLIKARPQYAEQFDYSLLEMALRRDGTDSRSNYPTKMVVTTIFDRGLKADPVAEEALRKYIDFNYNWSEQPAADRIILARLLNKIGYPVKGGFAVLLDAAGVNDVLFQRLLQLIQEPEDKEDWCNIFFMAKGIMALKLSTEQKQAVGQVLWGLDPLLIYTDVRRFLIEMGFSPTESEFETLLIALQKPIHSPDFDTKRAYRQRVEALCELVSKRPDLLDKHRAAIKDLLLRIEEASYESVAVSMSADEVRAQEKKEELFKLIGDLLDDQDEDCEVVRTPKLLELINRLYDAHERPHPRPPSISDLHTLEGGSQDQVYAVIRCYEKGRLALIEALRTYSDMPLISEILDELVRAYGEAYAYIKTLITTCSEHYPHLQVLLPYIKTDRLEFASEDAFALIFMLPCSWLTEALSSPCAALSTVSTTPMAAQLTLQAKELCSPEAEACGYTYT